MRFHQIRSKSRLIYLKYHLNLGFLAEILVFFAGFCNFSRRNLGFSPVNLGFSSFGGQKLKSTRRSWFMGGENSPSTSRIIGSIGFRSISVGSSGWVGSRMGLDRPTFFSFAIATILHSLISNSAFSCNKYSLSLSPSLCFALLYYHFKLSHTLELSSQHTLLLVFFFFFFLFSLLVENL